MKSHDYILSLTKNIIPSMRYDFKEDFWRWQLKAKSKLSELLGLPLQKCDDDKFEITEQYEKNGYAYTRFTFQSEEGYFVPVCMVKKASLKKKSPVCICLQGHSSGMHISLGEPVFDNDKATIAGGRDFAVRAASEGMVAFAIEQRYMGQCGDPSSPVPSCIAGKDGDANEAMAALLIGRTAIGERVWDIMRTIDAIAMHFDSVADMGNVICLGNSGGGTATFYASCMDDRITVSVPSCAVCTYEASIMAMNHCPCNFVPNIRKYFDMGDLGALIAPRKFVLVCGKDDPIFPLDGVKESFELIKGVYDHIGEDGVCHMVVGNGGHQFYPDDAWPIIHKML